MSARLREMTSKQRLVALATVQRAEIASASEPVRGALGKLDHAYAAIQSARRFVVPVGLAAFLVGALFMVVRRKYQHAHQQSGAPLQGSPAIRTRPATAVAVTLIGFVRTVFSWWQVGQMAAGVVAQITSARRATHNVQTAQSGQRVGV